MGEGKLRCRSGPWNEGTGGVHKGHFYIPARMGEGGEEAGHIPTGVTYVTEKHSSLVKGTLTHLALRIIRGGADKEETRDGTGPGELEDRCLEK